MTNSSINTLTILRSFSSTLWSIRTSQEASKILRTTQLLLRCFLFFDICYLLSGISLIVMALSEQFANTDRMVMFGGVFGVLASISALCNSLASHGVRTWRRMFLIPWLMFFSSILVFLLMLLGYSLYSLRAEWRHIFLLFAIVTVFTCWRHMQRQFFLMGLPRPHPLVLDVESVMRELLERDPTINKENLKDLPPKYEELEDLPPKYDEQTMIQPNTNSTVDNCTEVHPKS